MKKFAHDALLNLALGVILGVGLAAGVILVVAAAIAGLMLASGGLVP